MGQLQYYKFVNPLHMFWQQENQVDNQMGQLQYFKFINPLHISTTAFCQLVDHCLKSAPLVLVFDSLLKPCNTNTGTHDSQGGGTEEASGRGGGGGAIK